MAAADPSDYPCPACGFLVFDEPPGSYGICEICGWEDDHVQLRHPSMGGGANRESLFAAQQRVLAELAPEVQERHGILRDPTWRPLTETEAQSPSAPRTGMDYFEAAAGESPPYYWRRNSRGE